MDPAPLDERTLEILRRDEAKFIQALELYYSRFHEKTGPTFSAAARQAGANPAYLVNYLEYFNERALSIAEPAAAEGICIGMPYTPHEASKFLRILREYAKTIQRNELSKSSMKGC